MRISIILLVSILIFGCTDQPKKPPLSEFSGEFTKRNISFESLVSSEFKMNPGLENEQVYSVSFDRRSRVNTVVSNTTNDTIFRGLASRHKGIVYLQHPVTDSTYWLQSIVVGENQILGWGTPSQQMYRVDSLVKAGQMDQLILQKSESRYVLSADKKELAPHFSKFIADSKPLSFQVVGKGQLPVVGNTQINPSIMSDDGIITAIFPNPAVNYVDIEIIEEGNYRVVFMDLKNAVVKEVDMTGTDIRIDIKDVNPGHYILALKSVADGSIMDQRRLMVSR